MRQGSNPNRVANAKGFRPVALCVVTHLPDLRQDYHARRLEVVQACLTSMRQGAHVEHTFMVWDNGSCPEFTNWLANDFDPDVMILSANIGKTAARTSMIRMLPPRTVVCYSDDDMYFYDNWLAPQIEILQHFPNVAAVSGYPVRTSFRWGNENTLEWARKNAEVEKGRFLPRAWEDDFAVSIGRDPEWHADYSGNDYEYIATYRGKRAYLTAHHCQFIGYQERLAQVAHYDNKAMGDEKVFDIALDSIGLRLATTDRLARHIGNVIDENLRREIQLMQRAYTVPANAR
jgi:glycosyltransferase involved in cell wall biosynthesis